MDDEQPILSLVSRMLQSAGISVTTATSGEQAIEEYKNALLNTPFYAVILDLTVPGAMGGREAAEHILRLDPDARLIVSSGYADDPILANYQAYGFIEVIAKPYTKRDLLTVLKKLMEHDRSPA